jgi:hypothetical protein
MGGIASVKGCASRPSRYTFHSDMATYYDILQVSPRAALVGVRASYRRLAQKYHPDKLGGNADAERVMAMLNEAYGVLSDPARRAEYDRRIAHERSRAQHTRRLASTAVDVPQAAWPWYLMFATVAFAAASVGTVVYKSVVPPVAVAIAAPAAPAAPGKN